MEAVIFVGVQASGKSTFYRARFSPKYIRVSLDWLKTRAKERVAVQACLNAGQSFVVDNTNVRAADRAGYIEAAKAAGSRVIGYYFRTELRTAIARNSKRTGKEAIPVPGLIGTFKRLQPPTMEEGFDELFSVELTREGAFVVESSS
jgi:predicted kinase